MGKKVAFLVLLMFFLSCTVSASSQHGSFEGNPIVKLFANGTELMADDVPAIIYNNRTLVPIYLLQQLGFEVQWNPANYSVHVKSPIAGNTAKDVQEPVVLEQTLQYLNDLNYSMILFLDKLKLYSDMENFSVYKQQWELDFDQLEKRSRDVTLNVLEINKKLNSELIWKIAKSQSEAYQAVKSSKELLSLAADNPQNASLKKNFQQSLLNSIRAAHQNYENTKDALHERFLKQMNLR